MEMTVIMHTKEKVILLRLYERNCTIATYYGCEPKHVDKVMKAAKRHFDARTRDFFYVDVPVNTEVVKERLRDVIKNHEEDWLYEQLLEWADNEMEDQIVAICGI